MSLNVDTSLHWGDILTIVIYLILCLAIGLWSSRTTNQGSVRGYFLAGKQIGWIPIGASIFATNVGSQFFIGMAGTAAASGIAVVIFEWHAIFILLMLGWIFLPVYIASGAYTMPEYISKRFGGQRLRLYLAITSIILYILQRISVIMYSGGVFIQQAIGWNLYLSVFIVIAITAFYTILGGLSAVIYADLFQTVVMIVGALLLTIMGLGEVGGISGLKDKYMNSFPNMTGLNDTICGAPREDAYHIFRDPIHSDFPWPGTIFGMTPMAMWVWCNDQVIVQRALAAKNLVNAKAGTVLAGYLKILPMLLYVLPGMISRALYADEVACVKPETCQEVCGNEAGCTNVAYPLLVMRILPTGLKGLMIAVIFAALMSSLTSIFNSASSVFTMDVWSKIRHKATERELMIVGRVFIIVLMVVSFVWIPILQSAHGAKLWTYLQSLTANLAPPWCAIYVLAIAWTRTTEKGVFCGLMVGLLTGVPRMIMDFVYSPPLCGQEETRPAVLYKVHYLYFSILNFSVTFVVTVVVSLFTEPRTPEQLRRMTWWTKDDVIPDDNTSQINEGTNIDVNQPGIEENANDGTVDLPDTVDKERAEMKMEDALQDDEKHGATISESRAESTGGICLRIYGILCGFSGFTHHKPDDSASIARLTSIWENPLHSKIVNVNAIILLCVAMFLFGLLA